MPTPRATVLDQAKFDGCSVARSLRPMRSLSMLALRVPAPAPALVNLSEPANIELDATVAYTD
ncbi:a753286a-1929-4a64-8071-ef99afba04eb [Thermothielavioides terrestris]|uniref:A753286a-1929-4a64-8071-ef99afba04eb n=1 Tax=Thermothielavioides terrestris TaxID=2587410 RepID=A0A3S4B2R8_9PEZI|nr:a753286a-1929-4a64-8071-ef99afba04eb [Thermothielavioides terrestris]